MSSCHASFRADTPEPLFPSLLLHFLAPACACSLSACRVLRRPDGRVFYEHIPTRKQQWRTPDELKGREEAEALPAVN